MNKYIEFLNNIKAPEDLKERTVASMINSQKKAHRFYARKILVTITAILVLAIIVTLKPLFNKKTIENNNITNEFSSSNNTDIIAQGVFIPAVKLPEKDGNVNADMIGLVVYNGKVYTQAEYIECDKATKSTFVGDFLGTASGTINEFSNKNEYDKEFASNVTGKVYSVNGYDRDFRICIPEMYDGCTFIAFFENLNGITLNKGKDLYGDRLLLKENYDEVVYQLHDDWNLGKEIYKTYTQINSEDINRFIDELYDSPFVDLSNETNIYDLDIKQAHVYFKMKDGTTVEIRLFENGYVGYIGMHDRIFVKINTDTFKKIFEASIK